MTAARKLPPPKRERWEQESKAPVRYERGEVTVRPREPAMQRECKRCGSLLSQQCLWYRRDPKIDPTTPERHVWAVLPCTRCPLDLGVRP